MSKVFKALLKVAEPLALLGVPIVLVLCALLRYENTALLAGAVAALALVPFFLRFEKQRPRPRDIMPIVVLAAVAVAGRALFGAFPNFKPVSAIVIVGGVCFGSQSGFLIGALAALASNMVFGQGPWTPWQMYAWGLMGYVAGTLAARGWLARTSQAVCYGVVASFLYGLLLDSWYILGFITPINWPAAAAAYGAGMLFNATHALSTAVFLLLIYQPWRRKLARVRDKYGLRNIA
nr:DUF6580 family putative transport protein [Maliibacterium massiliense]